MSVPWFFAPPAAWDDGVVVLPLDESHHALRVLRVAAGSDAVVIDGNGAVASCAVAHEVDGRLCLRIVDARRDAAPLPQIVLYQGAAKRTKVDEVVERAAELAVAELYAFDSERAVVQWGDPAKRARLEQRWEAIARSAAKVARSGFVMRARAGLTFADLLGAVDAEPLALVLWEEATLPLRSALADGVPRVALVVGPEGGFARHEVEALEGAGAVAVSLGPRILRTETAGPAAAAAVAFRYGLLG